MKPDWTPPAPLAHATLLALKTLSRQWPRAMALAMDTSEEGQAYLGDYASALFGVDLRAIPLAAREWIATENMPPRPADFGKLAREMSRQHFPQLFEVSGVRSSEHQSTDHLKNKSRIDALSKRAHAVLGTWSLVANVWALLYQTAPSEDHSDAVRVGNVPWDVFDDAVDAVKRGRRPESGPLGDMLGSVA